jgi:hypothetical protein
LKSLITLKELTERFVICIDLNELLKSSSFQLKKANIDDHPKQLLSILFLVMCGNLSIFLFFTWVNSSFLNNLEQSFQPNMQMILMNGVNTLTYTIYETIYLMTLFIIYFRLNILRKFSTSLLHCDGKSLMKKLKVTGQIWDTICDALDVIKFCYTISTSYYIISFTFNFVLSIYSIVSFFFYENSTHVDMIYMFLAILWTSMFMPTVVFMFMVAKEIRKQGKAIESQMHHLIIANFKIKKVLKEIELVLGQFDHRKPKITCGVFEIDWKFLFFLLGTSYSYLLIIVQFELK